MDNFDFKKQMDESYQPAFIDFQRAQRQITCRTMPGIKHSLDGELVISLTSHPPRYPTLHLTLESLLTQDVLPDCVVVRIDEGTSDKISPQVKALKVQHPEILKIVEVENIGAPKKSMFALRENVHVAVCDDDVYYPRDFLRKLLESWSGNLLEIVCHRAHVIGLENNGTIKPYSKKHWGWAPPGPLSSTNTPLMPTHCSGVFYPKGIFLKDHNPNAHPDALNIEALKQFAIRSDDVWFTFMAYMSGATIKLSPYELTPGSEHAPHAPDSQRVALYHKNGEKGGGKTVLIAQMIDKYGNPLLRYVTLPDVAARSFFTPLAQPDRLTA